MGADFFCMRSECCAWPS